MDVESLDCMEAGVAVFGALADPTRRCLLGLLVELRRASATRLAARLPVTRQAVIKHLHVLDTAGLVDNVRSGREVLYTARVDALEASARWLLDLAGAWRGAGSREPTTGAFSPAREEVGDESADIIRINSANDWPPERLRERA